MKCKHCGYENKDSAKFCRACGKMLIEAPESRNIQAGACTEKKVPTNSRKKKILAGFIAVLVTCAAAVGIYALNSKSQEEVRLVNSETGEYLIFNADKDLELEIKGSDEKLQTYAVLDAEGKKAATTSVIKEDILTIKAPKGGYDPGASYSISIDPDSKFLNEKLGKAKALTFIIYKKDGCEITYTDQVKQVEPSEIELQDNTLLTKTAYNAGEILLVPESEKEPAKAYKVKQAKEDGDRYSITYETPKIDELYKEIKINKTLISDVDAIEVNKNVVLETSKAMGILDAFTDEAEALSLKDIDCKITKDGKESLKAAITIQDPKHKGRSLQLDFGFSYKATNAIELKRQFIDTQLQFTSGIKVTAKGSSKDAIKKRVEKAIENFHKEGGEGFNTEKEKSKTFLNLFTIKAPLGGTIFLYGSTGLKYEFNAGGELHFELDSGVSVNQGVLVQNGKVKKKYANVSPSLNGNMMAKGSADTFLGFGSELGVELLPGSSLAFEAVPGVYGDLMGQFIMEDIKAPKDFKGYYSAEAGIKANVDLVIKLNYIAGVYKYDKALVELKKPFLHCANTKEVESVNLQKNYSLQDGKVKLGALKATYRDVLTEDLIKENIKDFSFYVDGKKVNVKKGVIQDPVSKGEHTFQIKWKYEGAQRKFEKTINVTEYYAFDVYTKDRFSKKTGDVEDRDSDYMDANVSIPAVSSTTKNYKRANQMITDFIDARNINEALQLAKASDYAGMAEQFSSYFHVEYEVEKHNDTTALVVVAGFAPPYPAGIDIRVVAVYYDNLTGEILSGKEYAAKNGYTTDQVLAAYAAEISDEHGVYEDLINNKDYWEVFYCDGNGNLEFVSGKYV